MQILINSGKTIAFLSFVFGTFLLAIHLVYKTNFTIVIIGLYYTILAAIINLIVFVSLLTAAVINTYYRFELLKTSALLLLNIPAVILYLFIVFSLSIPVL